MRASLYSGASRGRARGLTALHFPAAVAVLALLAAFAAPPVRAQAGGSGGLAAAGGRIEFCLLTASAARTSATDCSDPRKLASLGAGSVIDAPAGSPLLNIRAAVTGVAVASVFFEISGPVAGSGTENVIPYDVFGDRGGHAFPPGDYTLEATVYDGSGRTGTVTAASTIAFSIRGRLGPPRELQTVSGPRQVNVGWRAPDTAREVAHYELRWAKAGAAWGRWHRKEVGANERELYRYRVDGLDGGAEYRFEVRAMAAASGTPEPGESAVVTGTPVVLGAPRSLEADAGHERVVLRWSKPSTHLVASRYEVRWAGGDASYGEWRRHEVTGRDNRLEYAVEGLANGTRHRFELRAYMGRIDNNQVVLVEGYSAVAGIEATPVADPAVSGDIEFCLLTASTVRTAATDCSDSRKVASLGPGSVIDAPESRQLLNIRAAVSGVDVESVFLALSGPTAGSRTENVIPWDLFGDRGGRTFAPGNYTHGGDGVRRLRPHGGRRRREHDRLQHPRSREHPAHSEHLCVRGRRGHHAVQGDPVAQGYQRARDRGLGDRGLDGDGGKRLHGGQRQPDVHRPRQPEVDHHRRSRRRPRRGERGVLRAAVEPRQRDDRVRRRQGDHPEHRRGAGCAARALRAGYGRAGGRPGGAPHGGRGTRAGREAARRPGGAPRGRTTELVSTKCNS